MACLCSCCKSRKGKSRESEGVESVGKERESTVPVLSQSADGECTEVEIDDLQYLEHDEGQGWTVARVFKNIFHASADSKIALKFYGNKKGVLIEQKRQDDECCSRWMIHPCSRFRCVRAGMGGAGIDKRAGHLHANNFKLLT